MIFFFFFFKHTSPIFLVNMYIIYITSTFKVIFVCIICSGWIEYFILLNEYIYLALINVCQDHKEVAGSLLALMDF